MRRSPDRLHHTDERQTPESTPRGAPDSAGSPAESRRGPVARPASWLLVSRPQVRPRERLLIALARAGEGRLRRRAARHGDTERRAGHVVEPDLVAERDRVGVAAMLAADAELE